MLALYLLAGAGALSLSTGCSYPGVLTHQTEPWVGKLHYKKGRMGELLVYFHENLMSVYQRQESSDGSPPVISYNRTCLEQVGVHRFIVTHEIPRNRRQYMCMELVMRGKAVLQLKTSRLSSEMDSLLCYTSEMTLDPWLYISFQALKHEHKMCSFSGGFNMKIRSSRGAEYGCNSMELPMRLESECIGGEGVHFQFRYSTCTGDLPMEVDQRAYCVADWIDGMYTYSVLRKVGHDDLWCLRTPLIRSQNFTSTLFLDVMCSAGDTHNSTGVFVSLNLLEMEYTDICEDEYPGCSEQRCTPYSEKSCQKSCGLCNVGDTMPTCRFPKAFRGEWLQRDHSSYQHVKIGPAKLSVHNVGRFKCLQSSVVRQNSERKYALLSTYTNGCRPRYTCVKFRQFGTSVISYTLSQSKKWPFSDGGQALENVCENSNFKLDPRPIWDTYRGPVGTFKALVPNKKATELVKCNLRQALKIQGAFNGSSSCTGKLYEDCNNPSRIRLELHGCHATPSIADFVCLSTVEGRYWETITIIRNMYDPNDARCFVLSDVREGELLMLSASQCDTKSWLWASGGERTGLGKFRFQTEDFSCRLMPTRPPTTSTVREEVTYRILTSARPSSRSVTPTNPPDEEHVLKTATHLVTPPSESLAKDSNLQNDSGNVAVVEAPSQENINSRAFDHMRTYYFQSVLFSTCIVLLTQVILI